MLKEVFRHPTAPEIMGTSRVRAGNDLLSTETALRGCEEDPLTPDQPPPTCLHPEEEWELWFTAVGGEGSRGWKTGEKPGKASEVVVTGDFNSCVLLLASNELQTASNYSGRTNLLTCSTIK